MELEWLWLALLGLGTGIYGVLVGAGGGVILGPMLLIFFDKEPSLVAGTTLALVAINTLSGTFVYTRMRLVDFRSGLLFAAAGIPGSVIAPFVIKEVAGDLFRILFGALLLALTTYILWPRKVKRREDARVETSRRDFWHGGTGKRHIVTSKGDTYDYQYNEPVGIGLNFGLGFIASFFGVGAGWMQTPIMVFAFKFPVQVAVATSMFVIMSNSLIGSATHIALGHIDWPTFVAAGVGLVAGGQIGAALGGRVKGAWIMRLLVVLLIAIGVRLIVEGIMG